MGILLLGSLLPTAVLANEGELMFHVEPKFPASQIDGSTSYFDLNLPPGETDQLELVLQNDSEKSINVKITPHTAYTNVNGVVEYGKNAEEVDPTLVHSLDELIENPDIIRLGPNETQTIQLDIKMPGEAFEGILAGGIRIEEVRPEEELDGEQEEGLAIKNEFSYVVGVVVSNNRFSITSDLELIDVFASQLNYRNVFSATIQNYLATFTNQLDVNAVIREKGKEEILYTAEQSGIQMAPNSHMHFPTYLEGERFRSGDYVLTMTARSGEQEWEWEREFTVETEEARRLNREDVTLESTMNWWMIVAGILIVSMFFIIAYLFYQQKKRKSV